MFARKQQQRRKLSSLELYPEGYVPLIGTGSKSKRKPQEGVIETGADET